MAREQLLVFLDRRLRESELLHVAGAIEWFGRLGRYHMSSRSSHAPLRDLLWNCSKITAGPLPPMFRASWFEPLATVVVSEQASLL